MMNSLLSIPTGDCQKQALEFFCYAQKFNVFTPDLSGLRHWSASGGMAEFHPRF